MHSNENFRRGNFTSADMKEADFSGSTFNGGYLEKAVAYRANFTGIKGYFYLVFMSRNYSTVLERKQEVLGGANWRSHICSTLEQRLR